MKKEFDPELLYVECTKCGQPLLWRHGQTTKLLDMAGIDMDSLDERCMLASDGCPACQPGETQFSTQVIRLTKDPKQDKKEELPADA